MVMHHSHELDIKERSNINNKHIQAEIQIYTECKVPIHQIHTLVNEKFQANVSFEQVYALALNVRQHHNRET